MNWRNILVGAVLPLIVTIIGGIFVVVLTRPPSSIERIVYSIDQPVTFETDDTKLSLVSAKIANVGTATATNVTIILKVDDEVSIVERKVQMSSGPAAKYELIPADHEISVHLDTFVPREFVTISAMVNGITDVPPQLSVRSAASVGESAPLIGRSDEGKWPLIKNTLTIVVTVVWLLALRWIWIRRRFELERNVNNLAFLCIHQGLTKEAERTLREHINRKGASAYELLNYGLALALNGKLEEAQKFFSAGEWLAKRNYVRALAQFNRSVASIAKGDFERAREHLRNALRLSRRQIAEYCEFSVHVAEGMAKDEGIAEIIRSGAKN